MTVKTLLLGAAAGTLAVVGAQAADLPVAAEPVDYVRVCDAQGTGFFYIPGTETCLRVAGGVRVELRARDFADSTNTNWGTRAGDATTFRARAYYRLDARTETELGLLRTYTDVWFTSDSGNGTNANLITVWDAFIQLGGFTAGRTTSFFDFYTGDNYGSLLDQGFSDEKTTLLGYTASFGNGLTASVSVEDGTNRRNDLHTSTAVATDVYGGHKLPDFVANLRVDQGWGSAQVMAAAHQVYGNNTIPDSALGWAVGAGVTFNLPMIAAGDSISFQAAYANGASSYVSSNLATDAVGTAGLTVDTATAWGFGGGFTHFWTSAVSTSVTASYASLDALGTAYDVDQTAIQGNIVWRPVGGLTVGAEVEYLSEDFGVGGTDDDDLVALLRIQRMF